MNVTLSNMSLPEEPPNGRGSLHYQLIVEVSDAWECCQHDYMYAIVQTRCMNESRESSC